MPADDSSAALARLFAGTLAGSAGVDDDVRGDLELAFAESARWAATGRVADISIGVTSSPDKMVVEVAPVVASESPDGIDPLDVLNAVADSVVLEEPLLRFEVGLT